MHFFTVIHPVKTEADKDGHRKPPTPYDLKGGGTWYDNGKCMITVHRQSGHPNAVDVMITKAKPKSVAAIGKVGFFYDRHLARFYWTDQGNKYYAKKEKFKPIGLQIHEDLQDDQDDDVPF